MSFDTTHDNPISYIRINSFCFVCLIFIRLIRFKINKRNGFKLCCRLECLIQKEEKI